MHDPQFLSLLNDVYFMAGLRFNELLNILQEDRRKYHDDVSVIVISFEGRIWRSAV